MMLKSYQPAGPLHLVRHGPKHVYDYIYIYKFSNLKKIIFLFCFASTVSSGLTCTFKSSCHGHTVNLVVR